MEFNYSKVNGTHPSINYEVLIDSIQKKLSKTVKRADLILLNEFPVAVSSKSDIDLILFLNIPKWANSYYRAEYQGTRINIHNQIVTITVIDDFIEDDLTSISNEELIYRLDDLASVASKVKWGFVNYLSDKCGMKKRDVTVHSVVWIKNHTIEKVLPKVVVSSELTYDFIEASLVTDKYYNRSAYSKWLKDYDTFDMDVKFILDKASEDSSEGYVTKKKLDNFQNKRGIRQEEAYDNIGKKLVEIRGKAGTGKTTELLKWMLGKSLEGHRALFLTYNHILVNDITRLIKGHHRRYQHIEKRGSVTTNTIQSFMYDLAKKSPVLHLMNESRISELADLLNGRLAETISMLEEQRDQLDGTISHCIYYVQSKWGQDLGTKREAIDFLNSIKDLKYLPSSGELRDCVKNYRESKRDLLFQLENQQLFLEDYTEVLRQLYLYISNLDGFIEGTKLLEKYDILNKPLQLGDQYLRDDDSGLMELDLMRARLKRSVSHIASKRILYLDEAQDCHPLERDIFFKIFGVENCVIANGGKEQLIRFAELCKWNISKAQSIDTHIYRKPSKSFRMKPAVATLANFIANWYQIDLNIEALDTPDTGQVVISTKSSESDQITSLKEFMRIGLRSGCSPYESVVLMRPSAGSKGYTEFVGVNEYGNIYSSANKIRSDWSLIKKAVKEEEIENTIFWDATGNKEKKDLALPGALSTRAIFYESCRGIEAWTTMCFGLDSFFEQKAKHPNSDNFLLNDLFDQISQQERKEKYAATWVLMAVTRSMENCYIQLTRPDSSLYRCLQEFYKENKDLVKVEV